MSKNKCIAAYLLIAVGLSGCATSARVDQMIARQIDPAKISRADFALKNNLSVQTVSGGKSPNPLWHSQVGNQEFKIALEQSLKKASVLASDLNQSRYVLDVELISLDQPRFSLDRKVTVTVDYTLKEKTTGNSVFHQKLSTEFIATFSDSALPSERLRLASEGAARVNIEKFIDELLKLNIKQEKESVSIQN